MSDKGTYRAVWGQLKSLYQHCQICPVCISINIQSQKLSVQSFKINPSETICRTTKSPLPASLSSPSFDALNLSIWKVQSIGIRLLSTYILRHIGLLEAGEDKTQKIWHNALCSEFCTSLARLYVLCQVDLADRLGLLLLH